MLVAGIATSGTCATDVDSIGFAGFAFAWYSGIGTEGRMPPPLKSQSALALEDASLPGEIRPADEGDEGHVPLGLWLPAGGKRVSRAVAQRPWWGTRHRPARLEERVSLCGDEHVGIRRGLKVAHRGVCWRKTDDVNCAMFELLAIASKIKL